MKKLLALYVVTAAFCFQALAQQYSIDWYKVAGGGGTSTGGTYTVSGTIGQHDAGGPMVGGNYSLVGGFWALISTVQTVGAPTLFITQPAAGVVSVYWQSVPPWTLQQNTNFAAANWSPSTGVTNISGTNYLKLNSPSGHLFFRLQHP